jgi:hypothetical protein
VSFKDGGKTHGARAEQLLVATGRPANTKGASLKPARGSRPMSHTRLELLVVSV